MLYPVNLDINGRLCLVIGGGAVAARKIETLLVSGARIRVVSPEACGKIQALAERGAIEWCRHHYRAGDVAEAFLVFAATSDPDVQRTVARDASRHKVLLNSADDPDASDFQVPARFRRGKLLIAVSTEGGSPALAARIKQRLAHEYGPEYELLVEMLHAIRREVIAGGCGPAENKQLFHEILNLPVLDCLRLGNWLELQALLAQALPEGVDSERLVSKLQGYSGQQASQNEVMVHGTTTAGS